MKIINKTCQLSHRCVFVDLKAGVFGEEEYR
jgi:hypothetical protein